MAPEYETITVTADGPVATVTLNRPEQLNAHSRRMGLEIGHALVDFDADDRIGAIVMTGAGRAFCAGADISGGGFGKALPTEWAELQEAYGAPHPRPYELRTPIVGAINGPAVGFGATLAMELDIRVAAEDARIGFIFNRRGIMPDGDIGWALPRLVGTAVALDLILTGRMVTGLEAASMGLVSRAVPASDVVAVAHEIATDIATNVAPVSAAVSKRLLWDLLAEPDRTVARRQHSALVAWAAKQPDAREGVDAFFNRRTPSWTMSRTADFPDAIFESS